MFVRLFELTARDLDSPVPLLEDGLAEPVAAARLPVRKGGGQAAISLMEQPLSRQKLWLTHSIRPCRSAITTAMGDELRAMPWSRND